MSDCGPRQRGFGETERVTGSGRCQPRSLSKETNCSSSARALPGPTWVPAQQWFSPIFLFDNGTCSSNKIKMVLLGRSREKDWTHPACFAPSPAGGGGRGPGFHGVWLGNGALDTRQAPRIIPGDQMTCVRCYLLGLDVITPALALPAPAQWPWG